MAEQSALNQQLSDQAAHMDNFVRNEPLYDVEKDLQNILSQQARNIGQSTQANDAANKEIAQQSSPPGGPRQMTPDMLEAFKKASDAQVAALSQAHDQTDQQVVQKLDDISQMQELVKISTNSNHSTAINRTLLSKPRPTITPAT